MSGFEDFENLEGGIESFKNPESEGLSDSQMDYLQELGVSPEDWEGMKTSDKTSQMELIMGRFQEMGIPKEDMSNMMEKIYGHEISEYYTKMEAPQDFIQIDEIASEFECCEDLKFSNWQNLELEEKIDVLNGLEEKIADIEHRPSCPIRVNEDMGSMEVEEGKVYGWFGGYNPETGDITLNSDLLENSDPIVYEELVNTLVHEGRHAYQDYNINVCEVHPRHSEVESWAETMGGGKWDYWGDCSSELGQRLYEQQSVEIDARNFAADVMDKITDSLYA